MSNEEKMRKMAMDGLRAYLYNLIREEIESIKPEEWEDPSLPSKFFTILSGRINFEINFEYKRIVKEVVGDFEEFKGR